MPCYYHRIICIIVNIIFSDQATNCSITNTEPLVLIQSHMVKHSTYWQEIYHFPSITDMHNRLISSRFSSSQSLRSHPSVPWPSDPSVPVHATKTQQLASLAAKFFWRGRRIASLAAMAGLEDLPKPPAKWLKMSRSCSVRLEDAHRDCLSAPTVGKKQAPRYTGGSDGSGRKRTGGGQARAEAEEEEADRSQQCGVGEGGGSD